MNVGIYFVNKLLQKKEGLIVILLPIIFKIFKMHIYVYAYEIPIIFKIFKMHIYICMHMRFG